MNSEAHNGVTINPKSSIDFDHYNNAEVLDDFSSLPDNFMTDYKLKRVVAVFRHGHRTPMLNTKAKQNAKRLFDETFYKNFRGGCFDKKPSCLYKHIVVEPQEVLNNLQFDNSVNTNAVLTDTGADQLLQVGKQFQQRYGNLLREALISKADNAIYAVSTPIERTIESLQCVLTGMINNAAEVQPKVQINILHDILKNYMYLPISVYPELKAAQRLAHSAQTQSKFIPGYKEWAENVERKSGIPVDEQDIHHIRDYLKSFICFDMKHLCDYLTAEDLDMSEKMCGYTVALESLIIEDGLKMAWSPFLREVIQLLTVENGSPICLLSGHDTTINLIRLSLCALDYTWPDFGYNIEFELYERSGTKELFMLILFNLKPVSLRALSESGEALIPFGDFVNFVKSQF